MAKAKKERANKYEEKVSFNGSLEDLIKLSVTDVHKKKPGEVNKKESEKKKKTH